MGCMSHCGSPIDQVPFEANSWAFLLAGLEKQAAPHLTADHAAVYHEYLSAEMHLSIQLLKVRYTFCL